MFHQTLKICLSNMNKPKIKGKAASQSPFAKNRKKKKSQHSSKSKNKNRITFFNSPKISILKLEKITSTHTAYIKITSQIQLNSNSIIPIRGGSNYSQFDHNP